VYILEVKDQATDNIDQVSVVQRQDIHRNHLVGQVHRKARQHRGMMVVDNAVQAEEIDNNKIKEWSDVIL
jgi:hypothetical protein